MANMEAKAVLKTVRIAPLKARLVIDLIRGKNVADAKAILANQPQRAARVIEKVLNSSIANAVNNFNMNEENLYVKTCYVDEAIVMKRAKMDQRRYLLLHDGRQPSFQVHQRQADAVQHLHPCHCRVLRCWFDRSRERGRDHRGELPQLRRR